jgi:alcohol dehydrogenase
MHAAAMGGVSFDAGLLRLTHALEHSLSAYVPTLTHGVGLTMIQPAVVESI